MSVSSPVFLLDPVERLLPVAQFALELRFFDAVQDHMKHRPRLEAERDQILAGDERRRMNLPVLRLGHFLPAENGRAEARGDSSASARHRQGFDRARPRAGADVSCDLGPRQRSAARGRTARPAAGARLDREGIRGTTLTWKRRTPTKSSAKV